MSLNIPDTGRKRIVIAGAGFAGITFARKVARSDYDIIVVDRNNYHLFQPLLYQVATAGLSPADIAFPLRKLFHKRSNVHLRMAEILSVDAAGKTVATNLGRVRYDYLVLATGSSTNFYGMDDVEREAVAMKTIPDSLAIRNRFLTNMEKAITTCDPRERLPLLRTVIVGGGPAGVELAGAFAEMKRYILPSDYPEVARDDIHICLVEGADRLLPAMDPRTAEKALARLRKMGVEVMLGKMAADYSGGEIQFKDGSSLATRNVLWTSGVKVVFPEGLEAAERGKGGRMVTDMYMAVPGMDGIYCIGDAAIPTDSSHPGGYPQLAREAMEEAKLLARNFRNMEAGKDSAAYRHKGYPVIATVGRNHAYVEYGKIRIGGVAGWLFWAAIHVVSVLGVKNKLNVFMNWVWDYFTLDHPSRLIVDYDKAPQDEPEPGELPAGEPQQK